MSAPFGRPLILIPYKDEATGIVTWFYPYSGPEGTGFVQKEKVRLPLSASAVSSFRLCNRKWGWDKLAGVPRQEHSSTAIGTRVHAMLEDYLRHAKIPDPAVEMTVIKKDGTPRTVKPGYIAQKGIRFLPAPGTGEVEQYFGFEYGGVMFHGYIDWNKCAGPKAHIIDHKTTGSYKWIKTVQILLEHDEQSAIYACYALSTGAEDIKLQWVYYLATEASGARDVQVDVTPTDVYRMMAPMVEAGQQMYAFIERWESGSLQVTDMPYDPSACGAYGGCDYVDRCNLTSEQRLSAYFRFKDTNMDLLAILNANKGSSQVNSPVAAPSNPTVLPAQAAPAQGGSIMDLLGMSQQTAPAAAPAQVATTPAPAAPVVLPSPVPAQVATQVATPAAQVASGAPVSFKMLFVACRPIGEGFDLVEGSKLLDFANQAIQGQMQVPHYTMVEFGKGPALVIEVLKTATTLAGRNICVDRTFPPVVLEWLRSRAEVVIEGA